MHDLALIKDLALIWAVALVTGHLCIRLKLPVIAGYMLAGVIVGPHCLKWIDQTEQIKVLAEFGVAMLLFTLGVDLSLKQVASSAKRILSAGITQVIVTAGVAWVLAYMTGMAKTNGEGFLFGSICAISSSVVISRMLMDRGEMDSVHGRILVPLSLVQDLTLVAIIPFLPALQQGASSGLPAVLFAGLKAVIFVAGTIICATRFVPVVLSRSAKTDSREIFVLTILVLCLAVALLSQMAGLSIALGAFLAGIMMSESVYAHQALHDVAPLRDIFSIIFFVSVGMLLDPVFVAQHWPQVCLFVTALIAGKAIIGCGAALLVTKNLRSAILTGVGMSQIGEFSFVLLTMGYGYKLVNESIYNLFVAAAVVSMIASPGMMAVVPRIMRRRFQNIGNVPENPNQAHLQNHVVVCGFGRIGRNIGHVLEAFQLPFVVIELNAEVIEELALRGIPHVYGDAMNQLVLSKAQLSQASVLVLTMPDPLSAEAVAAFARNQNPSIKIVARAHRPDDIGIFSDAGVNAVVQPEFEASIEITRLVLHCLNRPAYEVHRALVEIRTRRYAIFQPDLDMAEHDDQIRMGENQLGVWFTVTDEIIGGRSIADLNVRGETGATITAVKREDKMVAFPDAVFELAPRDEVYAVGSSEQLHKLEEKFALIQSRRTNPAGPRL